MEMTELMKRYEAETDECATWTWHEREFLTDDYIAWLETKANISDEAIKAFQEIIRTQCDEISALKEKIEIYGRLMSVVRVEMDTQECVEKQELQYMNEYDIDLDEFSEKGFKTYVCEKANAYDRLMSGGKKTMKELANILGRAIVVDASGNVESFAGEPIIDLHYGFWYLNEDDEDYEDDRFLIPRDIVDFNGDWKDSLTLPDGWRER